MASAGAGPGAGFRHLHSALAVVLRSGNRRNALGPLVTTMATIHYLAWAIPALGFLGTVRGLAMSLTMAGQVDKTITVFLQQATQHLNTAFDCTLIALALSLPLMFLIHSVQRE